MNQLIYSSNIFEPVNTKTKMKRKFLISKMGENNTYVEILATVFT